MNFNKNMNAVINDFLDTEINGLISKNYFLDAAKEYKNNRTKNSIELTGNAHNVSICNNMVVVENIWDDAVNAIEISIDEYIRYLENFYLIDE